MISVHETVRNEKKKKEREKNVGAVIESAFVHISQG